LDINPTEFSIELCMVRKMIEAIRNNNQSQVAKYDDIAMNMSGIITGSGLSIQNFHSIILDFVGQKSPLKQQTFNSGQVDGIKKTSIPIDIKSLRYVHKVSKKEKLPVYDVLKQYDFIKSPETDFYRG